MNNITNKLNDIIEKIDLLGEKFAKNKGIILTEDDLKCLIFHSLYELFEHNEPTFDENIKGSRLHSELKFFDEKRSLRIRPDIVIVEPSNYSILHSISDVIFLRNGRISFRPTTSKEYEFGGDVIVIELKFCKSKQGITNNIEKYRKDIDKIKRLQNLATAQNQKILGLLVVFNKTNIKSPNFENFINEFQDNPDIRIKYYSSNVEF